MFSRTALAAPVVVAGAAGVVGNDVIVVSEAYFAQAVRTLEKNTAVSMEPIAKEALKTIVSRLLFESMVIGEMKALKIDRTLRPTAVASWQRVKQREKSWRQVLTRYAKTENDAIDSIWNFMEVEAFVEKKVETFVPIITDAEVERYYQQNITRLGADSLEKQRAGIRTMLQNVRIEKSFEEWIRFLREKYAVVNLLGAG